MRLHDDVTPESFALEARTPAPEDVKGLAADARFAIDYTNWRGDRARRVIRVLSFGFGTTEYHPDPDLMVIAIDEEKDAVRTFAFGSIHAVAEAA